MLQTVVPYVNEVMILCSALLMGIGWWQIRRNNLQGHKRLMVMGAVLAVLFFISYAIKTVWIGDTTFGGPSNLKFAYQASLQIHSLFATVAAVLGILVLRFAYRKSFLKHKQIGSWTISIWFVTAASSLVVFSMLYVVYRPGPTTNVLRAWLGY
jgi:putative membrane protein